MDKAAHSFSVSATSDRWKCAPGPFGTVDRFTKIQSISADVASKLAKIKVPCAEQEQELRTASDAKRPEFQ
jgi:hypothetical protein